MSLISEALKKARQEAAKQDAAQRGVPYAIGTAEHAGRRNLWAPLVAGLAAGAVVVGALVLAAYLGHWGPWKGRGAEEAETPASGDRLAAAPPAAAPPGGGPATPPGDAGSAALSGAPAPAPIVREDQLSTLPPPQANAGVPSAPAAAPPASASAGNPAAPPSAAIAPGASSTPRPAPGTGAPAPGAGDPTAGAAPSAPAVPAPPPPGTGSRSSAPAPAAPAPAPPAEAEEKVYTGELPVPGGGVLHLNGIAFSDSPVAVFDGKVMGPGEVVQGFTIVEIQRGRVRLQGHGMSVVLAVR